MTPVSIGLILVPAICWFYFLSEEISDRVSPAFSVLLGLGLGLSFCFLGLTMFTEPGILPTITYEEYVEADSDVPVRITSRILLEGREYELKQFRAKFSRYTANCVENYDHYCPWVGNAIGKRNYRHFIFFMMSSLILAILVAASCTSLLVIKSVEDKTPFINSMEHSVAATVLAIYGYLMVLSLLGLCGFHIRAIASNTTTNEILKGVYSATNRNPYDNGCYRNCCSFLCSPLSSSRVADLAHQNVESPLLGQNLGSSSSSDCQSDGQMLQV